MRKNSEPDVMNDAQTQVAEVLAGTRRYVVIVGDVLDVMSAVPEQSCDCSWFDPPYGLGTREPTPEELLAYLNGGSLELGDFMNRNWAIPPVSFWKELYRVLKPGAISCFYGGTRTDDLLSMGARMAGFSRDDAVALLGVSRFAYVNAQGMVKFGNLGSQVDAAAGVEREVLGTKTYPDGTDGHWSRAALYAQDSCTIGKAIDGEKKVVTAPATDLGARWEGYYGGLAPKYEPLLVFAKPYAKVTSDDIHAATGWTHWHITRKLRKPHHRAEAASRFGVAIPDGGEAQQVTRKALTATAQSWVELRWRTVEPAADADAQPTKGPWQVLAERDRTPYKRWHATGAVPNLLVHGVGGLNIDATRVDGATDTRRAKGAGDSAFPHSDDAWSSHIEFSGHVGKRFAPNVCVWHHAGCRPAPPRRVRSGITYEPATARANSDVGMMHSDTLGRTLGYADADGTEAAPGSICVAMCDDPDCAGETRHPSGGAPPACHDCAGTMTWACAAATLDEQSGHSSCVVRANSCNSTVANFVYGNDTREVRFPRGHTDEGGSSRFYPQFWPSQEPAFRYAPKSPKRERQAGLAPGERNPGICRKSVERFGRRQVRQLAPPGSVIIVPYCGTGSEVIAALLEGYRVIGIERNPVDAEIARRQAEHVLAHGDDWIDTAAVNDDEVDADEPSDDGAEDDVASDEPTKMAAPPTKPKSAQLGLFR